MKLKLHPNKPMFMLELVGISTGIQIATTIVLHQ